MTAGQLAQVKCSEPLPDLESLCAVRDGDRRRLCAAPGLRSDKGRVFCPSCQSGRAITRYADALAALPPSGGHGCHAALLSVANYGAMAGLTPAQVFADLRRHAHGTRRVTDAEIRSAVAKAFQRTFDVPLTAARPRARIDGASVRDKIIRAGAETSFADLWEQSTIRMDWPHEEDAWRALSFLYAPDEMLFIGDDTTPGIPRDSIRTAAEWIDHFKRQRSCAFPKFIPNPVTGKLGQTKDGRPSFRSDDCVAAHRFMVCEFDTLTIDEQVAFWCACPKLPVAAIVHSGKKSLHALVRVDCVDADEWEREVENKLFPEILVPMGLDAACKNEARLSRMPGHIRTETGQQQTLLYLAPAGKAVSE